MTPKLKINRWIFHRLKLNRGRGLFLLLLSFNTLIVSCARSPIRDVSQAMRVAPLPQDLADDLEFKNFSVALQANISRLRDFAAPLSSMRFGPFEISKEAYIESLERLELALRQDSSGGEFTRILREEFDFLEVYGGEGGWGEVFVTGYYEPLIFGRKKKVPPYTQPLYERPKDLVVVDMKAFAEKFADLQEMQEKVIEKKSRTGVLWGRQIAMDDQATRIVPYYSRQEIDGESKIDGVARVIAYVEPVDAFFLQIQGSGRVQFLDGKREEVQIGYADQNGHPYEAIGKYLFHVIPQDQMSAQKIARYLRSAPAEEAQAIMNLNSSYIFFKKLDSMALSFFGAEAQPGRTIATDQKYFPKGALAFLQFESPVFADSASEEPVRFEKSQRFVLDQDTGGAIRGPQRVDLFWGRGDEAARASGVMRNVGRLYYILPKERALWQSQ